MTTRYNTVTVGVVYIDLDNDFPPTTCLISSKSKVSYFSKPSASLLCSVE